MAKRASQDIKNKKAHSHKTRKRLAVKYAMLAIKKAKKARHAKHRR